MPLRIADIKDARYAWDMAAKHRQSLFISARARKVTLESLDLAIWNLMLSPGRHPPNGRSQPDHQAT